jgi:serine/threonine protein kinase
MDKQYEQYCAQDALFYDSAQRSDRRRYFPAARRPLPQGWRRTANGDWIMFYRPGSALPRQGWKIHVSACQENATHTLTKVWEYCLSHNVPFKIMGSPLDVLIRNMKYAPRHGSGKAATIYPSDAAACERVLRELDAELDGAAGPYILSDLRFGDGPLYVRYGGFAERLCRDSEGEMVPAIETPSGDLVPDVRSPVFTVPDWVELPEFLAPHLAARNSVAMADLQYNVTGALHFSNGGGVYTATDKRDGCTVILKEARPHAGLAADGSDAVTRLRREHDLMLRLSGLGIAPEVRGYFHVGDHHFLVEEFIDGSTLNSIYSTRYPLTGTELDPEEVAAYTSWALRTSAEIERAAGLMHDRGIVFGDLHPFNIMIRPDETVAFIDFEAAGDSNEERLLTVANPGYAAPRDRTGFAVDAYSLACLRLALFMPLTTLIPLGPRKAAQLATAIAAIFPVPSGFLDEAVAEITGSPAQASRKPAAPALVADRDTVHRDTVHRDTVHHDTAGDMASFADPGERHWPRLSADLVRAIRASATPERTDRLFPGDVDQFRVTGGGITLAYGAAGVLFALSEATGTRVRGYEDWLLKRLKNPPAGLPLGLYDGLSGVAWTLARLGHRDAAVRVAERCLDDNWEHLGHSFYSGLAGFGLAMLEMADSAAEPALADAGLRAAEIVAGTVTTASARAAAGQPGPAGLMHGAAGKALLLIRMYERTRDPAYLDAAATAITADLGQCVADRGGGLQVNEGWRILPYLKGGSAGIGMVISQFLPHRDDAELAAAAGQIATAASSVFYVQSGLFNGRAGLLCFLAGQDRADRRVRAHATRLAWHAVPYQGGLAFPGDMLLRLSMDLGTGTAGVLLGLATAFAPRHVTGSPSHTVVPPRLAALPCLAPPMSSPSGEEKEPELTRR